jgi:hypothetical protein
MPDDADDGVIRLGGDFFRVAADLLWLWDCLGRKVLFSSPGVFLEWMQTPSQDFGGRRPIEVLAERGREPFRDLTYRSLNGVRP